MAPHAARTGSWAALLSVLALVPICRAQEWDEIVLWPEMVSSIPTVDQRVTLVVLDAVDDLPDDAPDLPSPGAGARPAGDGNGALASQPVPSD